VTRERLRILFVNYGEDLVRGQERVLLDIATRLDPARFEGLVWCNSARLAHACRSAGLEVVLGQFDHFLDFSSPPLSIRRYVGQVRDGARLVRSHGIDVIHANGAAPAQWMMPAAALTGRPLVAHIHTRYLRRSRFVLLLHAADALVAVSQEMARPFLEDGMPPDRIHVIHNGYDEARLRPSATDLRAALGIAREAFVVCAVGALIDLKGHDLLISAFARLPAPAHLLIAGSGAQEAALRAQVVALGLAGRVHFLGQVEDVMAVFQASDVFALASRKEGFPLVLLEAGLAGLPCVATRVGGVPEAMPDGRGAMLVPPDDPNALADALLRYQGDPAERRRAGEAARRCVEEIGSATRMAERFATVYERLAARDRPRRRGLLRPYLRLLR
jgi:glycosyltransferase involved in cell wall biosynthesis